MIRGSWCGGEEPACGGICHTPLGRVFEAYNATNTCISCMIREHDSLIVGLKIKSSIKLSKLCP